MSHPTLGFRGVSVEGKSSENCPMYVWLEVSGDVEHFNDQKLCSKFPFVNYSKWLLIKTGSSSKLKSIKDFFLILQTSFLAQVFFDTFKGFVHQLRHKFQGLSFAFGKSFVVIENLKLIFNLHEFSFDITHGWFPFDSKRTKRNHGKMANAVNW